MASRPWTTKELDVLRAFAPLGVDAVASLLERSQASVSTKARELHVSLKATEGDVDLGVLPARLLTWVRATPSLRICPMCARRLALMQSTGLCRVCHLDRLIELRREELDVVIRQKRLDKIRQDKRRVRICDKCGREFYPSSKSLLCSDCRELS